MTIIKQKYKLFAFMIIVKMLFSSFNGVYSVPIWITYLTEDDGTIHKCHRLNYIEIMEFMEINSETIKRNNKYYDYSFYNYKIWERCTKFKNRKIVEDMLNNN